MDELVRGPNVQNRCALWSEAGSQAGPSWQAGRRKSLNRNMFFRVEISMFLRTDWRDVHSFGASTFISSGKIPTTSNPSQENAARFKSFSPEVSPVLQGKFG